MFAMGLLAYQDFIAAGFRNEPSLSFSQRFPLCKSHLSLDDVSHVSPVAQKLHHLFASARQLGPTGFGIRVLFQPTNFIPVKNEIHLPQALPWSDANWIAFSIQLHHVGVSHENLSPDFNQRLLEGRVHVAA
jgi:hypothetical protein